MADDGVKISASEIVGGILRELGPQLKAKIDEVGRKSDAVQEQNKQAISSSIQRQKDTGSKLEKAKTIQQKYMEGAARGGDIESDLNELKSGRFAGVLERKGTALISLKEQLSGGGKGSGGKTTKAEADEGASALSNTLSSAMGRKGIENAVFKNVKIEKVTFAGGMFGGGARGGMFGGGVSTGFGIQGPTPGGGGTAGTVATETAGSSLSSASGVAMGIGGAILAAGGLLVRMISSISGMYQSVMQSQSGSMEALNAIGAGEGGYTSGGGRLVSNAEFGQIRLMRARMSESGTDMGDATAFDPNQGAADIAFGVSQGIGGMAGARAFAGIQRYGGLDLNRNVQARRNLYAYGQFAGYGGSRQGEFMQGLEGMAQQQYMGGFGRADVTGLAQGMMGLTQAGLHPERSMALMGQMQGQFQTQGSTMQNLAMAAALQQGRSPLEAMSMAEQGGQPAMRGIQGLLNLQGMDPQTQGLVMRQLGIGTATENLSAASAGGNLLGAMSVQQDTSNIGFTQAGQRLDMTAQGAGTTAIGAITARANEIDEIVSSMSNVWKVQQAVTEKLIQGFSVLAEGVDYIADRMMKFAKRFEED